MNLNRAINELKNKTIFTSMFRYLFGRKYYLSDKNILSKQERALRRICRYAANNCEYYKEYFAQNPELKKDAVTSFPILDKKTITSHFNDFISRKSSWYLSYDAYTGGSTGEPFHFLKNGNYEYYFSLRKWKEYGYKLGDRIIALDGSKIPESDIRKGVYWKKSAEDNIPFGSIALSSLYLSEETAQAYCAFLLKNKPAFIRGYPSFVHSMACYYEHFGLKPWKELKGIELTSETAIDSQIETISRVFDTKVYLQYGHSESCVFGYTFDSSYRYKTEPLYGFIEVLDSNGKPVKKGDVGEVVVTSLHNRVMPLIRYRTGDYAVYGGQDNRYVYLDSVLGRTQDYIISRSGKKVLLTAMIFGQHFSAMGHMNKWQIVQNEKGVVEILIIKNDHFSEVDELEIKELFNVLGDVDTIITYVDSIPLTPRGKSQMLIQKLSLL